MSERALINRLLIIDDEPAIGDMMVGAAKSSGYDAVATSDIDQVKRRAEANWPTHIILDLQMPNVDGVEVLRLLSELGNRSSIVLCSGVDPNLLEHTRRLGLERGLSIVATLSKPVRIAKLRQLLSNLKAPDRLSRASLERAIKNDEIAPYFQPLVEAGTRRLHSVEVLARWLQVDGTVVPPGDFIGLAEAEGLMDLLTDSLIRQVIRQLADWQRRDLPLNASINLSPSRLTDLKFVDWVMAECRQASVGVDRLTFELTETAAMGQLVDALDILARLRLKGVRLAIDDFGTGYSSMMQLRRLPFTELKIDRYFVADFEASQDARAIVRAMIKMSHELGLRVVAEGIENESTAEALRDAGCDILQGFLFSPALPPDQFFYWAVGAAERPDQK